MKKTEDTVVDGAVAVVDQAKRGRGRPRKYDFPSKLTCTATGRVVKTNPTQFANMLKASGLDQAAFIASYKCRAARKAEKVSIKAAAASAAPAAPATPAVADTPAAAPVEG